MLAAIQNAGESCAIHIRRGDFLGTGYTILGMDYYESAIGAVLARFPAAHFFIFGNDLDFMRRHFGGKSGATRRFPAARFSVVALNGEDSAALDFILMRAAKHAILANSTLSMWVGFLCDGLVVYKGGTTPCVNLAKYRPNCVEL